MKIISKAKDYFDFLQGIYGIDEKLVLDRTIHPIYHLPYTPSVNYTETFYVGEYQIDGYWYEGKLYFGEDVEQFNINKKSRENKWYKREGYYTIKNGSWNHHYVLKEPKYLGDKCPTWKEDFPLLIYFGRGNKENILNPFLKDWNLQKYISPETIWQWLTDWLSKRITKNEAEVPIGDDKTRILSHGFDLKQSFRHRK